MRTLSIVGFTGGLMVIVFSIWRWSSAWLYDSPFRLLVGCFIGLCIMGFSYILDFMTLKDKISDHRDKKYDNLERNVRGIVELNDLKIVWKEIE